MRTKYVDLSGKKFGRWTAISYAGPKDGATWLCRCDCGTERVIRATNLKSWSGSCGCKQREIAKETASSLASRRKKSEKHGATKSYEYAMLNGIIQRCHNSQNPNYGKWGGLGISVCSEWREAFGRFISDMGKRPSENHHLRLNYGSVVFSKHGCKWVCPEDEELPGTLLCSRCKKEKPFDLFKRRPGRADPGYGRRGKSSHCIDCEKEASKQPHRRKLSNEAANRFRKKLKQTDPREAKRRERSSNLKRLYGITEKEYEDIHSSQDGRCAICGDPESGGRWKKRFHIDHNHETGKIRGLLCHGCNVAIGSLRENVTILENAIKYIEKHNNQSMSITVPIS